MDVPSNNADTATDEPERPGRRPALARYGVAVGAVALIAVLRLALTPLWGPTLMPFVLFFPALVLSAWYGRIGPAIVSIVLSALAANWFFVEPRYSLLAHPTEAVGLLAYVAAGLCLAGAIEAIHRSQARLVCESHQRQEAEQSLMREKELLTTTLASIGDAVLVADAQGRVISLNPEAERLTGWKNSDAASRPLPAVFAIVNEETRQPAENPVDKVLRLGMTVGLANHTVLVAKDGAERPIDDSAAPIRDKSGEIMGVVLVFRDITERRKAEDALRRSERELADFFENASIALHWVGADGTILRVNQKQLDVLGYTREEYLGRHIAEFHEDQPVIDDILARLARGETLREYPARMRRKGGSIRDVLIDSSGLFEDGRFIHSRCFTRDITEHKRAQEALRDSEERLRATFSQAAVGMALAELDGRFVEVNEKFAEIVGYTTEELRSLTVTGLVHSDDRARTQQDMRRLLSGERSSYVHEKRYVRKDGGEVWSQTTVTVIKDTDGKPQCFIGVIEDISRRKRAEAALREREERYELVLAGTDAAIWDWDVPRKRVIYSPRWKELRGLSDEEVSDREEEWTSRIHPDDVERVQAAIQAHFEGRTPVFAEEYRVRHKDGRWIWILDRGVARRDAEGRVTRMAGSETDITKRKEALEAQRESEARERAHAAELQTIMEAVPAIIWIAREPNCRVITGNRAAADLLRIPVTANASKSAPDDERPTNFEVLCNGRVLRPEELPVQRAARGEEVRDMEEEVRFDDGTSRYLLGNATPLRDAQGRPSGAVAAFVDITDRKGTEEALRESEERLAGLIDSAMDAVIAVNEEQRVVLFNPAAEHMFGCPAKEAVDSSLDRFIPARFRQAHRRHVEQFGQTGVTVRRMGALGDLNGLRANGEEFPIEASISHMEVGGRKLFTVILRDITERKKVEAALRDAHEQLASRAVQLEKLVQQRTAKLRETIGELEAFSYSMAHDMRAPLRAMSGFAELLLEDVPAMGQSAEARNYCQRILAGADRLDRLILDALNYTKAVRQELPIEPVDLAKLMRNLLDIYPNFHADHADIHVENNLPTVLGNESLLTQCFSNLLGNAVKFVAAGVRPRVRVRAETADHVARVWVEDNGIGIAPRIQQRLFGIFQKLDSQYEGTGIGLAIVRKVVERMGGKVGVESEPGQGSRFWVDLPLPGHHARAREMISK